jgi:hypothetical protein
VKVQKGLQLLGELLVLDNKEKLGMKLTATMK